MSIHATQQQQDSQMLSFKVGVMKAEVEDIRDKVNKMDQKQDILLQFMYKFEGGKAWLAGLVGTSALLGGLIATILQFFWPPKI